LCCWPGSSWRCSKLHLQAGLGDSALRAGLTFAPCALVFGACGFFWRRLPERVHHLLAPASCLAAAMVFAVVAGVPLARTVAAARRPMDGR